MQTQNQPTVKIIPLPKRNYENVIAQYEGYVKKLRNLEALYKAELELKKQNKLNMAEIAVKQHELHLKILVQEKLYTDHVAHYATTVLPQYNMEVEAMNKNLPEVKEKLDALVELKVMGDLTEKQEQAVKIYDEFKSLTPEIQKDEEVRLEYYKLVKKVL